MRFNRLRQFRHRRFPYKVGSANSLIVDAARWTTDAARWATRCALSRSLMGVGIYRSIDADRSSQRWAKYTETTLDKKATLSKGSSPG
jgi:hypothetical protein